MSEPAPSQVPTVPKLRDLAKMACEKHKDIDRAVKLVLNRLNAEPLLRDALLDAMVRTAVESEVYSVRAENLSLLKWRATDRDNTSISAVAGVFRKAFLDNWTMPDGRVLGDYTGEELKPEAEYNRSTSAELARKAKYYEKLAALAGNRTVKQAIGDDKAEKVWNDLLK